MFLEEGEGRVGAEGVFVGVDLESCWHNGVSAYDVQADKVRRDQESER
jgi:hypothetical protein